MAMIQDAMNGFFNNASAGLEISTQTHDSQQHDFQWQHRYHPPAPTDHLARSVLCFTPFPLQWCELYLSWNLAFIAGQFEDTLLYMAMLLCPFVLEFQQQPELFMYRRVMALYLHVEFVQAIGRSRCLHHPNLPPDQALRVSSGSSWKSEDLAQIWGQVNNIVAKTLRKGDHPTLSGQLWHRPLNNLIWNFAKIPMLVKSWVS